MENHFEPGGPHDSLERDLYEGEGTGQETESDRSSQDGRRRSVGTPPSSPPGSPRPNFAPRGPVTPRLGFKGKIPRGLALNVGLAEGVSKIAENIRLKELQGAYKNAINSVAHAKHARGFIEELSFLIIASSLLNEHPAFGPASAAPLPTEALDRLDGQELVITSWTPNGALAAGALGFSIAGLMRWFVVGGSFILSARRLVVVTIALGLLAWALRTHMRQQQAKNTYEIALSELKRFLRSSSEYDSMASSALSFIFEVELVARGYRLSLPLPPLSRLENNDNGQALKSQKLRHSLNQCFQDVIEVYYQTAQEIRDFASQKQLKEYDEAFKCDKEKVHEYMVHFVNLSTEDAQKTAQLRETLQLSRDARKMFLITLMSLEKTGSRTELVQYTTALQGIQRCLQVTQKAYSNLRAALVPDREVRDNRTSTSPTSPRHLKWKHQIDKVGGMNMSIRTIQAKMYSLLEESKKTLDTADDVSELGQMFMDRYESIGKDIEDLMDAWQSGKSSLAKSINKNERRVSSMSSLLSPGLDKSMEAVLEETGEAESEGGVASAWDQLTGGEAPPENMSPQSPEPQPLVMETFEAIATPRPRSLMTRAERIQRSHEERKIREAERAAAMQRGHVMGELRDVLKSRGLHTVVDTNQGGDSSPIIAPGPLPSPKSVGPRLSKRISLPGPGERLFL
ncbi:hypothetical protein PFICI_01769 [Pestalotiopsis fici W106-1]|uniref:Myosin-binding domain-containing protein n=1 Tax=Pestalotiopsis fici (strain W106-1 / CGMCC3.15140) TaxID=1229662 RepID=W3XRS6_PESFW|nr:uncharacterized protein PFICI_01769 [Pestalotiopsis fici W106-1]ETS87941.1 hypothetical protein PFICI_01769 [Pestalotiopsis fici W106-1]